MHSLWKDSKQMKQWRRRNRNTFARGLGGKSLGRRYADDLPLVVNKAFDAIVTYRRAMKRYEQGGGNALLVATAWRKVEETARAVELQS